MSKQSNFRQLTHTNQKGVDNGV